MPPLVAKTFVLVWILSELLYPVWLPFSGSVREAALLYALACAGAAAIVAYLRPALVSGCSVRDDDTLRELLRLPRDRVLWAMAAAVTLLRVYPLTLPVHLYDGGDETAHMGVPALPFKVLARNLPFPHPLMTWAAVAVLFIARKPLAGFFQRFKSDLLAARPWAATLAATLAAAYFVASHRAIVHFLGHGHATIIADLVRFPPLGKWILFLVYAHLGVSNLSGRLPEFCFFIAAGVALYKLALEFLPLEAARFAAAFFWLLPPFAYFSMRGGQTNGEIFFFILTAYFFAQWALRGRSTAPYWIALSIAVGSMYRYTLPFLGAATALWAASRPRLRRSLPLRAALECLGMMGLMLGPWILGFYAHPQRVYRPPRAALALATLAKPAAALLHGVSWPILLLLIAGCALSLSRKKDELRKFLLFWAFGYYLFIAPDMAEVIRLDLPMLPPLILCAADALFSLPRPIGRWAAAAATAYAFVIGTFVAAPTLDPRLTLLHSVRNEYAPLAVAAEEINQLPEGTRILGVDAGRGGLNLYVRRPQALHWTEFDASEIRSMEELRALCAKNAVDVVLYASGTREAMGRPGNAPLFEAFRRGAPWLAPKAEFSLGRNTIAFKNYIGRKR